MRYAGKVVLLVIGYCFVCVLGVALVTSCGKTTSKTAPPPGETARVPPTTTTTTPKPDTETVYSEGYTGIRHVPYWVWHGDVDGVECIAMENPGGISCDWDHRK